MDRFTVGGSQERQDQAVVDHFRIYFDIPNKAPFGYSYWLKLVKSCEITIHHAKKLTSIMLDREAWLQREKGRKLERGKWMTNRFKEIKEIVICKTPDLI